VGIREEEGRMEHEGEEKGGGEVVKKMWDEG